MVCKNCNHEIDNEAMFCTYCGTPVEQTPEPETQPVENASTEDAAQNPYENVQTAQPEVDNAQPTADSQPQQNPYSQQYGQPNQTYYQQPQPNKTSYGQQFTNSPNNDYGANQSKYGNQYQSYNNGYNQQSKYCSYRRRAQLHSLYRPLHRRPANRISKSAWRFWIGVMLLTCLPIVNLTMLFVWAFSSSTKKSPKTMQEPLFIWLLSTKLVVVVSIILAVCGISIFNEFSNSGYYYH